MDVGVQNDLWAHQSFARKMTWKLPDKLIVFFCPNWGDLQKKKDLHSNWTAISVQNVVTSKKKKKGLHSNWTAISVQNVVTSKKKKSTLKLNRYFCPNCGDLQRPHFETVFLSSVRKIWRGKLAQTAWNCPKFWRIIAQKIWNCPKFWRKIVIWNCPKFCPKFGHLTPTEGASAPPPPTPMDKFMTKTCQNSKVMMQYSAQKPRKMIGIRFALYVFFLLVFLINQHSLCLLR